MTLAPGGVRKGKAEIDEKKRQAVSPTGMIR